MGIFIIYLVAVSFYFLIAKASKPSDTVFIKAGLTSLLTPFGYYFFCFVLGLLGAKGMFGGLIVTLILEFICFPLGILLVLCHIVVKAFTSGKKI